MQRGYWLSAKTETINSTHLGDFEQVTAERYLVAFDFETTGLQAFSERIVEFGAVKFDCSGNVVGQFQELANPGRPIPADAVRIHGITDADVAGCAPSAEVLRRFVEFIAPSDNLLFAHNAKFDAAFLAHEMAREGISFSNHTILDSMEVAQRLVKQHSYSLEAVSRTLKIPQPNAHRALADALTVKDIVLAFIRRNPGSEPYGALAASAPHLSLHRAGIEQIDVTLEFPEIANAMFESSAINFIYQGGSIPGQRHSAIPRAAFIFREKRYLSAVCPESHGLKTFNLDLITVV